MSQYSIGCCQNIVCNVTIFYKMLSQYSIKFQNILFNVTEFYKMLKYSVYVTVFCKMLSLFYKMLLKYSV